MPFTCHIHSPISMQCCRCSSFSVDATDIVDTTGAGDAFVGGFLFGMMQRLTVSVSKKWKAVAMSIPQDTFVFN